VRDNAERSPDGGREKEALRAGRDNTEKRRPEENAREHFPDDRRLADGRDQAPDQPPRDHHDRQREQNVKQEISGQCGSAIIVSSPAQGTARLL